MAALGNLAGVQEGGYFHAEQQRILFEHANRMAQNGLLPQSALAALDSGASSSTVVHHPSGIPTIIKRSRPQGEYVYSHKPSLFPMPKPSMATKLTLGTGQVSMGRARWNADGASIFSVEDGKRLAQTPVKEPTVYERIRSERIARAELETPLVRGIRLLPVFSPGRAFFWGTVLAVWGTAATFVSVKRSLGIHSTEDANEVLANYIHPVATTFREAATPVREALQRHLALPGASSGEEAPEIVKRMRAMFVSH